MKQLAAWLKEYNPIDYEEAKQKSSFLSFIEQHEDCFSRSNEFGHVTASSWLVDSDNSRALLIAHKKLGIWCQPGGHCDGDPNVLAVALKEAQEESGINSIVPLSSTIFDLNIHYIPEYAGIKSHYHYDVRFLLQIAGQHEPVPNEEVNNFLWLPRNLETSALSSFDNSIKRLYHKWTTFNS